MLLTASKYASARAGGTTPRPPRRGAARTGLKIFVPKAGAMVGCEDYFWKELREGGYLHSYLARERARTRERYRKVARATAGFQQNNKSDMRVVAHLPLRDFLRWKRTDPDFFKDNKNLKSLKRTNSDHEVKVYV